MRGPHSSHEGQPGGEFEFVIDEKRFERSGCQLALAEIRIAGIVEDESKKLIVMLPKSVETKLQIVSGNVRAEGCLAASVVRSVVIDCAGWKVHRAAIVVGTVVVVK